MSFRSWAVLVKCEKNRQSRVEVPFEKIIRYLKKGDSMELKHDLPKFSPKPFNLQSWRLRCGGLTHKPQDLAYGDLLGLPKVSLTDDFSCLEGWRVENIRWEGVRLSSVIEILDPMPEARFVLLASDEFSVVLPLARALENTTILALRKDGFALDEFHGGPARLVLRDQQCYESVKGLNRISLLETQEAGTAARIALGRIRT
jgi:DMSO/TMAO reductase YedYZ molybdopterin-dependent catalytic subunit